MNLFEKQQKAFAIKLSDRVKEEIKKEFYVDFCNYKLAEYFIFISKDNWAFSLNKTPHTLITEAEFFGDGSELTPMQELIEYIELNQPKNKVTDGIWAKAKSLLQKEKQVNEQIWNDASENVIYDEMYGYDSVETFENYYNLKFNQDE